MPQLDIAFFLPQIFWLVVIFAVLYLFVAYSAAPKIAEVLDKRQNRIAGDLEKAGLLQAQADVARIAHEKAVEDARAKATVTISAKRESIKAKVEADYNALSAKLNEKALQAEKKIQDAKNKALDEVQTVASDICKDIVARISGLSLEDGAVADAVGAEFDSVKEKSNG